MMRATLLATALLAATTGAMAQQRQQPKATDQQWRPAWAANLPEQTPDGMIGLSAFLVEKDYCRVVIRIHNGTDATIRYFTAALEFFYLTASEIGQFSVSFVDPGKTRDAEARIFRSCPRGLTRVVLREVTLCTRDGRWRRGCGAGFVPIAPRLPRPTAQVPIEIAPDFEDD